ncbi:MAG: hypothetical protein AABX01_07715 [Candidatus Micrarchaeota archaeon]
MGFHFNVFGRVFMLLLIISLIGYSLSFAGVPGTLIDSYWKLFALVLAISLICGYAYPYARGIRKNDQLLAQIPRQVTHDGAVHTHIDTVMVVASQNGMLGQKIHVKLHNGKRAEGIITAYSGAFSPATIRLTESEV